MKSKLLASIVAAGIAAVLSIGSAHAQSTTYADGDGILDLGDSPYTFFSVVASPTPLMFEETHTFSIGPDVGGGGISIVPLLIEILDTDVYAFSDIQAELFQGLAGDKSTSLGAFSADNTTAAFTLTPSETYTIYVSGTTSGSAGGAYSGVVAAVAAVPEPEQWALMLGGLGLIGWTARKARKTGQPLAAA